MRRFADPSRCPGCSSPLVPGSTTCTACGTDLSGPLGYELWTTLTRADQLLDQLRARSVPVTSQPIGTPAPPLARSAEPPRVRASSVPQLLLGLGAVCLLVAALVFLAVTWSRLGVGGRTATLVGFTVTTGALTAWAARRGLRAATEALGAVTFGLAVLDLYGADNAHWLGDPSPAGLATIIGAALVAAGFAATQRLARTAAGGFTAGEVAIALGAALVSGGLSGQDWATTAVRVLLVLGLVSAAGAAAWRLVRPGAGAFRIATWSLVAVLALDWSALVVVGLDALGPEPTMASAWLGLAAWPLVAAAAVALLAAAVRPLVLTARLTAAAAGLVALCLALLAPAADESSTTVVLAVVALSLPVAALMLLAPRPWGTAGLAAAALCGVTLGYSVATSLGTALERYSATASVAWEGSTGGRVVEGEVVGGTAPWLLPVCGLALLLLGWAAVRLLEAGRVLPLGRALPGAAGTLAVTGVVTLLLHPVPVWIVLVAAGAVSVGLLWPALTRDNAAAAVLGGGCLLATVVLSWYDEHLTAATLLLAVLVSSTLHLRTRLAEVAAASAALVAVLLAGLTWTTGTVAGAGGTWTALTGLVLVAALTLGRPSLRLGLVTTRVRSALELAAAASGVVLVAAGMDAANDPSTWLAVYLTTGGAALTVLALTKGDRRPVAWWGGLLLAAATWVRLSDLGVSEPEPYTLPSALVLLGVGTAQLRRDRSAATHPALGAGLALALVPSLVWVLDDPTGPRALLLGLACLGLVVGGAQLRWLAPLLHGAVVGLLVVLREAGPAIGDSVPRWALIGAAGALLIAMGVTWEQRLRDARLVTAYIRGLR